MASTTEQALQLRDIHIPASPPWWPPAPGWWLLAALLLIVLLLGVWWLLRAQRRRRRQRAVLAQLHALEQTLIADPTPEHLAGLSAILKRLALLKFPRREVAALHGTAWLAFLDRTGGDGAFSSGAGRVLGDAEYQRRLADGVDVRGLMQAIHRWLQRNMPDLTTRSRRVGGRA